jgi:hypothetical protein
MQHRLAATLVVAAMVVTTFTLTSVTSAPPARAAAGGSWPIDTYGTPRATDNVILKWDEQLLSTIRAYPGPTGPTITARALGVLHTATYDAWAAYDPKAVGTRPDGPPQQSSNDAASKSKAISFAAYRVLLDLFPPSLFPSNATTPGYSTPDVLMTSGLGYDPNEVDHTTPGVVDTPAEVGNAAANAVINFRHGDGSNQLGDDPNGTLGTRYSDTTHYSSEPNHWDSAPLPAPRHWQPLCVLTPAGVNAWNANNSLPLLTPPSCTAPNYTIQKPLTPQWENVKPFGPLDPTTHYPSQFQLAGPPNDATDVSTALSDTANLTDASKAKAEYWADGPKSEFPPGHMALFAQAMSRMRQNTLDQDAKLFFVLGNAEMDSSISAWAAKYQYDFWRPTSAIRELYRDKLVTSWLGPKKGFGKVLGQNWMPYQALNVVTPPFPEYVSGHSTFSAAGRTVLAAFYGNESFGAKVTIKAGSSTIEPGVTPAKDVVLSWKTLSDAADEAGLSRRYGGIHFSNGDQQGRVLGRLIAYNDWNLAQAYFGGTATP